MALEYVGMKVDAFLLNEHVISNTYFIAPISRPDYSKLLSGPTRLDHDLVPDVDLRNAYPWKQNSRIANVASGEVRPSRRGVYLHWCVPKPFRAGVSNPDRDNKPQNADGGGGSPPSKTVIDVRGRQCPGFQPLGGQQRSHPIPPDSTRPCPIGGSFSATSSKQSLSPLVLL